MHFLSHRISWFFWLTGWPFVPFIAHYGSFPLWFLSWPRSTLPSLRKPGIRVHGMWHWHLRSTTHSASKLTDAEREEKQRRCFRGVTRISSSSPTFFLFFFQQHVVACANTSCHLGHRDAAKEFPTAYDVSKAVRNESALTNVKELQSSMFMAHRQRALL